MPCIWPCSLIIACVSGFFSRHDTIRLESPLLNAYKYVLVNHCTTIVSTVVIHVIIVQVHVQVWYFYWNIFINSNVALPFPFRHGFVQVFCSHCSHASFPLARHGEIVFAFRFKTDKRRHQGPLPTNTCNLFIATTLWHYKLSKIWA